MILNGSGKATYKTIQKRNQNVEIQNDRYVVKKIEH